jgi:hypothetical protein
MVVLETLENWKCGIAEKVEFFKSESSKPPKNALFYSGVIFSPTYFPIPTISFPAVIRHHILE